MWPACSKILLYCWFSLQGELCICILQLTTDLQNNILLPMVFGLQSSTRILQNPIPLDKHQTVVATHRNTSACSEFPSGEYSSCLTAERVGVEIATQWC